MSSVFEKGKKDIQLCFIELVFLVNYSVKNTFASLCLMSECLSYFVIIMLIIKLFFWGLVPVFFFLSDRQLGIARPFSTLIFL